MELTTPEGDVFQTYLVGPADATKAVLIIHDWWGMLNYNREWADQFAKLGYRAMVVDLYDGYHPADIKDAGEYMRGIDLEVAHSKLDTAITTLQIPHRKIAVLGWSFGGLQAQHTTLQNPSIVDALVLYYCRVILDKQNITTLNCPVLAIFAESERTWPKKQYSFEKTMSEANKILEYYSYDADHGFANPEGPRYDSDATEEALQKTVTFLEKYLV
ncbi:alpha/beta fold hydrolase [Candidatus Parabeggiatoa sp. HSG14]|uniref:dienelactone hydrolase family protein n=1 Tax=Candidatus Parabeggiatoa sp. HSG14 TaxID=3055593 RepID=UPI0025A8004B|nr:dienelactone hydrolase family protein [Thiotrichales bacterium HSG14]